MVWRVGGACTRLEGAVWDFGGLEAAIWGLGVWGDRTKPAQHGLYPRSRHCWELGVLSGSGALSGGC